MHVPSTITLGVSPSESESELLSTIIRDDGDVGEEESGLVGVAVVVAVGVVKFSVVVVAVGVSFRSSA